MDKDERDVYLHAMGEQIRSVRTSFGMTQEVFAGETGLSAQVISDVENGKRDIRVSAMFQMADNLSIPIDDLVPDHFKTGDKETANTDEEKDLIQAFRNMSDEGRMHLMGLINSFTGK